MRRTLKAARVLFVVASAAGLSSCGDEKPPLAARSSQAEKVTVAIQDVPDVREFAGVVTTERSADARARINGTVTRLAVREGDNVKSGDLLVQIEDRQLALMAAAAAAQVKAASGEAQRAESDFARTKALHHEGIYSDARLAADKARADAASGALAAAQAQHAASLEVVAQGAVRAAADGRVLRADLPVGSVVMAGQSVMTLTSGDKIIRLEIPEDQARALTNGASAKVRLGEGNSGEGRIERVYPESRSGAVRVDVAAPGLDAAFTGQKASVTVQTGSRKAMVIPARFVRTRFGLETVLLADSSQANADPVSISVQLAAGPSPAEREVISGLSAGDVIVAPQERQ